MPGSPKLAPCPNPECPAGCPSTIQTSRSPWTVTCLHCCMDGPLAETEDEAARLWNLLPRRSEEAEALANELDRAWVFSASKEEFTKALVPLLHRVRSLAAPAPQERELVEALERIIRREKRFADYRTTPAGKAIHAMIRDAKRALRLLDSKGDSDA